MVNKIATSLARMIRKGKKDRFFASAIKWLAAGSTAVRRTIGKYCEKLY